MILRRLQKLCMEVKRQSVIREMQTLIEQLERLNDLAYEEEILRLKACILAQQECVSKEI